MAGPLLQPEAQSGGVAGGSHQAGGVVPQAVLVKEPELPALQIKAATMRIEQMRRTTVWIEQERHGVNGEVPASKILFKTAEANLRIRRRAGVPLSAGCSKIEQQFAAVDLQFQLDCAEPSMGRGRADCYRGRALQRPKQLLSRGGASESLGFHH